MDRFSVVKSDPRFIKPKKKDTKLTIDDRFSSVFGKEFSFVSKSDKYGRKIEKSVDADIKKFYKLDSTEVANNESDNDSDEADFDHEKTTKKTKKFSDEETPVKGLGYSLIRGDTLLESSESEEEVEDVVASDEISEDETLGPASHRFAVVNLDWDYFKSSDLYKVFEAFKPSTGKIVSVSVYLSQFGKERLEMESSQGPPKELFDPIESDVDNIVDETAEDFDKVRLRQYQLERQKYYYAVVVLDSVSTAQVIFEACNGTEFEKSANVLELQYIPDSCDFPETPVNFALEAPTNYTPNHIDMNGLMHSNTKLKWDEDDVERLKIRKKFTKDDILESDFKAYIASASEDEDEEEVENLKQKYKSLVQRDEEDTQGDMEITFVPGLSEQAEAKLAEKSRAETETVFDVERRKRKEKSKLKKTLKDEVMEEKPRVEEDAANLELMMMDDNLGAQPDHFDMKQIRKAEKLKMSRKKKHVSMPAETQDDFAIDVSDARFAELQSSHLFAIDPTNPNFKATSAMTKLLQTKRNASAAKAISKSSSTEKSAVSSKSELDSIVASLKRKAVSGIAKR